MSHNSGYYKTTIFTSIVYGLDPEFEKVQVTARFPILVSLSLSLSLSLAEMTPITSDRGRPIGPTNYVRMLQRSQKPDTRCVTVRGAKL